MNEYRSCGAAECPAIVFTLNVKIFFILCNKFISYKLITYTKNQRVTVAMTVTR